MRTLGYEEVRQGESVKKRPNFIVIHADQMRWDCLGANGMRKGVYTPNIDSIGFQGATFSSSYATCPLCIPQRLSLLTGQTTQKLGIFANIGIPYIPLETTLPTEMRKGGYQTALIGRTMHTYPFRCSYGFEYYLPGDPSSEDKNTSDPFFSYIRQNTDAGDGGYYGSGILNNSRSAAPFHLEDRFHQTKWATSRAIDFLENRDPSRPYMLFVGYYAPHSPHNPPFGYFNRYYMRDDLDDPSIADYDVPPFNNSHIMSNHVNLKGEELRALRAGYYGNIAFMDAQIGRLLEKAAFSRDTYVIFTSDHGDMLGDHYLLQKNRPYEGAVHLPFVIMGPGIRDSQVIDSPVGWQDLMPTILDLASLEVPASCDGKSLKPLLDGKKDRVRDYMHGECVHDFRLGSSKRTASGKNDLYYEKGSQYLTDGRMKYIWYCTTGAEQLFDLKNDPHELNDLSGKEEWKEEKNKWRSLLVKELENRKEGYVDGGNLKEGVTPASLGEYMSALLETRRKEGCPIAYYPGEKGRDIGYENRLMN